MINANARDAYGRTPLWMAAKQGHAIVVKLLLDTGKVDVDARDTYGRTPLSCAAERGHYAVVSLLLGTGKVDADARDQNDRTPLSWAVDPEECPLQKRDFLLEAGVDFPSTNGRDYQTHLMRLEQQNKKTLRRGPDHFAYLAVIRLLLETDKVDVGANDKSNLTPLSRAAAYGHAAVNSLLYERYAR